MSSKKVGNRLQNVEKVKDIVEELRKVSTYAEPTFETLVQLKQLTESIQLLQDLKEAKITEKQLKKRFVTFQKWFTDNGGVLNKLRVARELGSEGTGLEATAPLDPSELAVQVPRSIIMSADQARNSPSIGSFLSEDKHVKDIDHLVLALFLLHEKQSLSSFWHPYINVLPQSFPFLPFQWRASELAQLKGSPILHELIRVFKVSCMQYSYVYQNFMCEPNPPIALATFTFSQFLWALSIVWTRKNQIPLDPPSKSRPQPAVQECLIPMWDFANHYVGKEPFHATERIDEQQAELAMAKIATFFNFESDCCESHALRPLAQGEQFYIFYGNRHRGQVLLYSGFLPPAHLNLVRANDALAVALVFSDAFEHYEAKTALLERTNLLAASRSNFALFPDGRLTDQLIDFLCVLVLTGDELASADTTVAKVPRTMKIEDRALTLLLQTCGELMACYPTDGQPSAEVETIERAEQDQGRESLATDPAVRSARKEMARDLLAGEQQILQATMANARKRRKEIAKKLKKRAKKASS